MQRGNRRTSGATRSLASLGNRNSTVPAARFGECVRTGLFLLWNECLNPLLGHSPKRQKMPKSPPAQRSRRTSAVNQLVRKTELFELIRQHISAGDQTFELLRLLRIHFQRVLRRLKMLLQVGLIAVLSEARLRFEDQQQHAQSRGLTGVEAIDGCSVV
jgi:hypothetical protein